MTPAPSLLKRLQRRVDRLGAAEHVVDDVGAVEPRQHVAAVADAAVDEGHVMDLVERRHIGVALDHPDLRGHRKFADPLDQLFARLPIGDQIGDRDPPELVPLGEARHLRAAHHRAVVVDQLADHADRLEIGEPAEIDRRFGVAGAHQHAAFLGDQREDVAGADKVRGARIAVGEIAHSRGAVVRRDAGGGAVPIIDRHREGGAVRAPRCRRPSAPGAAAARSRRSAARRRCRRCCGR